MLERQVLTDGPSQFPYCCFRLFIAAALIVPLVIAFSKRFLVGFSEFLLSTYAPLAFRFIFKFATLAISRCRFPLYQTFLFQEKHIEFSIRHRSLNSGQTLDLENSFPPRKSLSSFGFLHRTRISSPSFFTEIPNIPIQWITRRPFGDSIPCQIAEFRLSPGPLQT